MFKTVQQNPHIVAKYFDIRTKSYFDLVMSPVFDVGTFWYRQEFAKSRGMVHWHGLAWRNDHQPHKLMFDAIQAGLSESECAEELGKWASQYLGLTASHPAGCDASGQPNKHLWAPPEGTAQAPPDDMNPLIKLLMDISENQQSLLDDYIMLCNRINLHRCSDYCLRKKGNEKVCRMEFGSENSPGKPLRSKDEIVRDKNKSLRLEMKRDHPVLVQHSRFHTQAWRANGDISLILSKSDPKNPSVNEIIATEKYVSGYACKGNEGTGALVDLYKNMVTEAEDIESGRSLITKLLMNTVKRDISAVEASYELCSLPLFRSSHAFTSVSLSGSRVFERNGSTISKSSVVDKYLSRNEEDNASLYSFVTRGSRVPVVSGLPAVPWPLHDEYCRIMLLLHWPNWRNLSDIKDQRSWVDIFQQFLTSDACPNFVKAEVERAKNHSSNPPNADDEADEENHDSTEDNDEPEWMSLVRPNAQFEEINSEFMYDDGGPEYNWSACSSLPQPPPDMGTSWVATLDSNEPTELQIPDVNVTLLNSEQKLVFNIVMKTIQEYQENTQNFEPLRLIVGGTAGSGKSFLIKCLVKTIRLLFNSNKSVQILCPTGNSANLISGVTLHSFFKIPVGKTHREMKPPDGQRGEALQANCSGLKVLLVDERSLIGATTLGWMEWMSRYGVENGAQSNQSWGGIPVVVFFGDDIQLPPVLDSPVYNCKSNVQAAMHGVLVWKEFNKCVILNTTVRQQGQDQEQFRSVLKSLRQYETNAQQAKWLQNFQWEEL